MEPTLARIASRQACIGVVGLGYVGLTVAVAFADAGFRVVGIERDASRAATIAAGRCPISWEPQLPEILARAVAAKRLEASTDYALLARADVVVVAVETPVGPDRRGSFASLRDACASVGRVLRDGALVIVESTVAPGTCATVVAPALEVATGRARDVGFLVGHCPERLTPGRLLSNLREMPRACGSDTSTGRDAMVALYATIVHGKLEPCAVLTAEVVKTAENAYRDVNLAFANELGLVCEAVGADFSEVRSLVNACPGRDVLMAGAGVGGHCIPKDSWLLAHPSGSSREPEARLIAAARTVNDGMPAHVVRLLEEALAEVHEPLRGARVVVYGYAYREDTDDVRNSPSQTLVDLLAGRGAAAVVHDPWVPSCAGDAYERASGAAGAVIMVAHSAYRGLDLRRLACSLAIPVLVDGRLLVEAAAARAAGLVFRGVGRGHA